MVSNILYGSTSGSQNSGSTWFSSSISITQYAVLLILVAVASDCVLEYTLDGSNYVQANGGTSLIATRGYALDLPVKSGDAVNLRQSSGSAVTVTFCRIHG
jgi:hypothetical protein